MAILANAINQSSDEKMINYLNQADEKLSKVVKQVCPILRQNGQGSFGMVYRHYAGGQNV